MVFVSMCLDWSYLLYASRLDSGPGEGGPYDITTSNIETARQAVKHWLWGIYTTCSTAVVKVTIGKRKETEKIEEAIDDRGNYKPTWNNVTTFFVSFYWNNSTYKDEWQNRTSIVMSTQVNPKKAPSPEGVRGHMTWICTETYSIR